MLSQDAIDIMCGDYIVSAALVDDMWKFKKKHRTSNLRRPRRLDIILKDLVLFGDILFNSKELLDYEKAAIELRDFCEMHGTWFSSKLKPMRNFIKYMDDMRAFYELNKNASIKDKRYDIIIGLRAQTLLQCGEFKKLTKKRWPYYCPHSFFNAIEELQEREFLC